VGNKELSEAWATCDRGDWMLWYAKRVGVNLRTLTAAKAECAALVLHLMKDERSRNAVEVARSYGRGEATDEELSAADAAAYAAYAAADAAADAAAYAAYAAASADVAYAADVMQETLAKCAEIVRGIITVEILESAQVAQTA
jgi:hypothetical protein